MKANATIVARRHEMPSLAANKNVAEQWVTGWTHSSDEILIATINRPNGDTGIHAHTRSLVLGMARARVRCKLISPFSGTSAWLPVFAVRPLLLKRLNKTWSTRWHRYWHRVALERNLRARIEARMPNVIIAQCPVSAFAALNVRRELGIDVPIVAVCHFNYSEANEYRDKGELCDDRAFQAVLDLEVEVLRRVDKVIYVSQWAQRIVEGERGIVTRSSQAIWNGISEEVATRPVDRSALGLSAHDVVVLNVGSLEPRKNQLGLLDLFARIAKENPAARLLLVGDGPDRAAIEQKILAMGLNGCVKCLGFRSDVPALLGTADLYLHFARLENCPVVLLEAARAGVPAATVPAGGAAEILDALGAGALLNPDDLDESMRRLSPLLASPHLRGEMGERARAGFVDRFTQEAMVRGYLHALQSAGAHLAAAEVG